MSEKVLVSQEDAVLVITINRPERRNALDGDTVEALSQAMHRLDTDPTLRVGIITGAGSDFCSGMDLGYFAAAAGSADFAGRGIPGLTRRTTASPPLIAAVEGHALAGGCEIVLACDLVVASRSAALGLPEVRLGLVAAAGGVIKLPRWIPQAVAAEHLLTGEPIPAPRAHELGLVGRLAEPGAALPTGLDLAARIAANGPLAVRATAQLMRQTGALTEDDAFEHQQPLVEDVLSSADAREGALAFKQRREPAWRSR